MPHDPSHGAYSNYEITKEGEEFIDAYMSNYRRIFGSSGGRPDSETLVAWLNQVRESGDFHKETRELVDREGAQKAQGAVDWAVGRRYLTPTADATTDLILQDSSQGSRSQEQRYFNVAVQCDKCNRLIPPGAPSCPYCGAERPTSVPDKPRWQRARDAEIQRDLDRQGWATYDPTDIQGTPNPLDSPRQAQARKRALVLREERYKRKPFTGRPRQSLPLNDPAYPVPGDSPREVQARASDLTARLRKTLEGTEYTSGLTQDMLDGMEPSDRSQAIMMHAMRDMPDFGYLSGDSLIEARTDFLEQWKAVRGITD